MNSEPSCSRRRILPFLISCAAALWKYHVFSLPSMPALTFPLWIQCWTFSWIALRRALVTIDLSKRSAGFRFLVSSMLSSKVITSLQFVSRTWAGRIVFLQVLSWRLVFICYSGYGTGWLGWDGRLPASGCNSIAHGGEWPKSFRNGRS